jgi:hypothetical protein
MLTREQNDAIFGPSIRVFRLIYHSAGCLGRKSLYPFAILFRELSAEQKAKLLERAQHWPEPLAKQVAKVAGTAARFEAGLMDSSRKRIVNGLRFSCKNAVQSTI